MNYKSYKWCAVPQCKNTSKKEPNKVFVHVPNNKTKRHKWLKLARRNPNEIVTNSPLYFCEDHFDLPNDMDNYMMYRVMGSVSQVRMKPGCMPKKFDCQPDRITQTSDITELPYIAVKRRTKILEDRKNHFEDKSIVTNQSRYEEIASSSSGKSIVKAREHDSTDRQENDSNSFPECLAPGYDSDTRSCSPGAPELEYTIVIKDLLTQTSVEGSFRELFPRRDPGCDPGVDPGEGPSEDPDEKTLVCIEPDVKVKVEVIECYEHPPEIELENYKALYFKMKDEMTIKEIENRRLTDENQILTTKLQSFTDRIENLVQKHENTKIDDKYIKNIESIYLNNLNIAKDSLAQQNNILSRKINEVIKQNHLQMREIQELTKKNAFLSSKLQELSATVTEILEIPEKLTTDNDNDNEDVNSFIEKIKISSKGLRRQNEENGALRKEIQEVTNKLTTDQVEDQVMKKVKKKRKM